MRLEREIRNIYPHAGARGESGVKMMSSKSFMEIIGGILYGLLWPVEVTGIKEVMESERWGGKLFSKDDPKNRMIIE